MIGTILNVAGILVGGTVGLFWRKGLVPKKESWFRLWLAVFTVYYGLRLTWNSLNGSFSQVLKQLAVVLVSMMLGKLAGRLARLQKGSNRIGQSVREQMENRPPHPAPGVGFKICAALFCAAPLGILGAVQDGLSGYYYPLLVKGAMEALATLGFVQVLGWGAMLSALPVLVFQGSIALSCQLFLGPILQQHGLVDSVNAVGGVLVFSVALVILELKRIEMADYLPSLIFAPLITWILR